MKRFDEEWTNEEINGHLFKNNVLVLFVLDKYTNLAQIIVYGVGLLTEHKDDLKYRISSKFGDRLLTDEVCSDINEFAEKWYNKNILNKKARTLNKGVRRGI